MAKGVALVVLYVLVCVTCGLFLVSTSGEEIDPSTSQQNNGPQTAVDDLGIQTTENPEQVDSSSINTVALFNGTTFISRSNIQTTEAVNSSKTHTGEDTTDMSSTTSPETSEPPTFEISSLLGKTLNFSYLDPFADGVQLTLANKPVDFSAFTVDMSNVKQLDEMLRGRNISEFLYIASKLAGIEARIAELENRTITILSMEDLFDPTDDIVLTSEDVDELEWEITQESGMFDFDNTTDSKMEGRTKRKAIADTSKRWSTTIQYKIISSYFDYEYTKAIKDGIQNWEEETCLNFRRVSSFSGSHLIFKKLAGCWSSVGRSSNGQTISIGKGCEKKGVVAHEIAHALGFKHEHQRPDRNSYVRFNFNNIKTGERKNFYGLTWNEYLTSGIPYDYSSVMHYSSKTFSGNGLNTIAATEEDMDKVLGQRISLSFYDVKLANYLYCKSRCRQGLTWSACQNDGYRDPKDCSRCKCPDGWTGRYCNQIKPGVKASCGTIDLTASTYWRTMKSPNYDTSGHPANSECTWRIKTSGSNKRIRVKFTGNFGFYCTTSCWDYIEIRYKDMAKAGPRYCCYSRPTSELVSHGNEVLLLMRTTAGVRRKGFSLQYKVESCGGCSVAASTLSAPACVDTRAYSCYQKYYDCSRRPCVTRYRHNTCYREVKTCCSGFQNRGNNCVRAWSNWSAWSSCSKTCNSGVRTRRRTCITPPCSGSTTNAVSCYSRSCTCSYRAQCGGWWKWKRYCTRYRSC